MNTLLLSAAVDLIALFWLCALLTTMIWDLLPWTREVERHEFNFHLVLLLLLLILFMS